VRLEGLSKFEKSNYLIGNRTRDLPACSIVPQPATLQRDPYYAELNKVYVTSSGQAVLKRK
jgi:hypothetical protein